ncbi:MAG: N-acetylneuraminate synthase family protein [Acholeplasma sp.]|nr:N-acetylneuraminate synthase family protein [Acholeplasma sp.]
MSFKIGNRIIDNFSKPYFIADIGANHDGDLKRALMLIELAAKCGADAAKFQNFKAETIVSKSGFDTMKKLTHQANWNKSVYEVYKDASISELWTDALKKKCDEVGIEYLTSPYEYDAVDLVDKYVKLYKIGSGDITWLDLIRYISSKGKPVLLATGASEVADVDRAYNELIKNDNGICVMQCNTNYTGSEMNFDHVNLNVLEFYKERYPNAVIGLSDHTVGYSTVLGAIALGACVIEKHFTDDNNRVGPDHKFAMNPTSWRDMVTESNRLYRAMGKHLKTIENNEIESAIVQRRAIYTVRKLFAGDTLQKSDLIMLRPCKENGIEPYHIDSVIGKKISVDIDADSMLKWSDLVD